MSSSNSDRLAKLSVTEKFGYGLGDSGFNFYWIIIGTYLAYFYTDIFGISSKAAALMFFVTKLVDACTDLPIGAIADRTNTRWGKFRPYLLFGGVPMACLAVLTMTTPDLNDFGKLVWVYVTYMAMMIGYTLLNMPYNSLAGVITASPEERNSIFGIRFVCAYAVGIFVGTATPGLAESLGNGNEKLGWQLTMVIYSTLATILFWVCFATTKERVKPISEEKTHFSTDIGDLLMNRPWLILFGLALILMITLTLRGGSAPYFMKYYMQRPDLLGAYVGLQMAAYAVSCAVCPFVANRVGKVRLLIVLITVAGLLSFAFAFVPKPNSVGVITVTEQTTELKASELIGQDVGSNDKIQWTEHKKAFWIFRTRVNLEDTGTSLNVEGDKGRVISVVVTPSSSGGDHDRIIDSAKMPVEIKLMFLLNILISLALGAKSPLTWSMYADAADYNEWKTGRRATAMTFAAATFSQKVGSAVGSAAMLSILASLGYAANQIQSGASLQGILHLQTIYPGVFAIIAAVAISFYNLDEKKLSQIQGDLAERESGNNKSDDSYYDGDK